MSGRYFRVDPIGFEGGINLYSYGRENPINAYDPEGTFVGLLINPVTIAAAVAVGVGLYIAMNNNPSKSSDISGNEDAKAKVEPEDRPWRNKTRRWLVFVRCNVHPNKIRKCETPCPDHMGGKAYGNTFSDAFSFAQMDANRNLGYHDFLGCRAEHCQPIVCYENGRSVPCPKTGRRGRR